MVGISVDTKVGLYCTHIPVIARSASLAVVAHGVVATILTNATTFIFSMNVDGGFGSIHGRIGRQVSRARIRDNRLCLHLVSSGVGAGTSSYTYAHTRLMTTADAVANKARIQRGDKANEVDEALNGGAPAFHTAMAKQGAMHGIAVGGCCELSTSAHHLVAKIGEEQGYRLADSSGMDIEDAITIATRLLKGRIAKQVWRDYHKHAFARRCYADPSDMGLKALQLSGMRREQDQTEREQLQLQHTLLTRLHHGWRRGIG